MIQKWFYHLKLRKTWRALNIIELANYLKAKYIWWTLKKLYYIKIVTAWTWTYQTLFSSLAGKHLSGRHKQASTLNVRIQLSDYENISVNTGVAAARTSFYTIWRYAKLMIIISGQSWWLFLPLIINRMT